ncbi:MAG TPA: hypothetical protein VFJ76_05375, partial [Solirubrobacterales bacterium]|nr:hypothetical protein [Solirubrobacterales bacterium]
APAHGSIATQWYVDEDAARADAAGFRRAPEGHSDSRPDCSSQAAISAKLVVYGGSGCSPSGH